MVELPRLRARGVNLADEFAIVERTARYSLRAPGEQEGL